MYEYLCLINSHFSSSFYESNNAQNCLLRGNEKGFAIRGVIGIGIILILAVISFCLISVVWSIYSQEKVRLKVQIAQRLTTPSPG